MYVVIVKYLLIDLVACARLRFQSLVKSQCSGSEDDVTSLKVVSKVSGATLSGFAADARYTGNIPGRFQSALVILLSNTD